MKLEHRKQKVATLPQFFWRLALYSLVAFGLIAFSVLLGTMGYYYLADLSLPDSFHMACMILTGMGPVTELKSSSAKIFSSFYALYSGVAFLSTTGVFFAPIVHRLLHILHVEKDEQGSRDD
jgi:hypothetical protein